MKKFWIVFGAIVIAILAYWSYGYYSEKNGEETSVFKVKKQDLTEIITEVGTVVPLKEIDLTFPMTGTVTKIHVFEGDAVEVGNSLAELETAKILADLNNANAAIQEAQAGLNKLLAGATEEDLQIYETGVSNAEIYLEKQKIAAESDIAGAQTTVDARETALINAITENNENLKQAYENALDIFNSNSGKIDEALGIFEYIQDIYFKTNTSEDRDVQNKQDRLVNEYKILQRFLDVVTIEDYLTIETALEESLKYLKSLSEGLDILRDELEGETQATITEKGYVDAQRTNISTAISNTTSIKQTISSATLDTDNFDVQGGVDAAQSSLDQAKATLDSVEKEWDARISQAEGELQLARDQLVQAKAPAREEDIALYKAQINQAVAYADLVQQNLNDTKLIAPLDGVITNIFSEVGELATASTPAISMITVEKYKIEVYISELDVAQVEIGDEVEVTFDAFGADDLFMGKVISIDPFETVDDGDIFYEITIGLDEDYDAIKSGMTVNVSIRTADKEEVITVPSRYIGEENGGKYLKVLDPNGSEGEEGEKYNKVEVITGLKGREMTEITSGVKEGQEIIPYY